MATERWTSPTSPETILSTELDGLADGSRAVSASISNTAASELYEFADFELFIADQAGARDSGARVDVYLLETLDGTNYTFGDASLAPPSNALVGMFVLDAASGSRYAHIRNVLLPPANFKILVENNTGQAFASSGNVVKMIRYSREIT